jgi:hypothetical protein
MNGMFWFGNVRPRDRWLIAGAAFALTVAAIIVVVNRPAERSARGQPQNDAASDMGNMAGMAGMMSGENSVNLSAEQIREFGISSARSNGVC